MKGNKSTYQNEYEKVYAIYFPKLVRFSRTYVISHQDAENIVQDIFLYLWEHKEMLESLQNTNAFLFTLTKNRCIDHLRKQTQNKDKKQSLTTLQEKELELKLYSLQAFDENKYSDSQIETIIADAVNSLPERCREIFILSRFEGLRHKEIAEHLNISTNTIEGQIAIALRKLKVALKNHLPLFIFII